MSDRISQEPDPVDAGKDVEIDVDTTNLSYPLTLTITFDATPAVDPIQHVVNSKDDLPWKGTVPDGCTGGTVEDSTNQCDDFAISVNP